MSTSVEDKDTSATLLKGMVIFAAKIILVFFATLKPNLWTEILFFVVLAGLIFGYYLHFRRSYNNINFLFILIFLVMLIFPLCHFINYKIDAKNFSFNEEFLAYKKNEYKAELKKYSDCVALEYFVKVTPDSLLNLKIDDTLLDKSLQIGNYKLKVAENFNVRRPAHSTDQTYKIIHLQNKSLKEVGVFKIWHNSIKEAINSKIKERNELVLMHNDMKSNLAFGSLYIDSLSGFVFSNFKPISSGSQFIQFLQLITFFFFLHAVSANLDKHGKFIIRKRNTNL